MTNLRRGMPALIMGRAETIVRYFNRGTTLAWELQAIGALLEDHQVVTALLAGLPATFELAAAVLCGQPGVTVAARGCRDPSGPGAACGRLREFPVGGLRRSSPTHGYAAQRHQDRQVLKLPEDGPRQE